MSPYSERGLEPSGVVVVRLLAPTVRPGTDDVALIDQLRYLFPVANRVSQ